VTVGAVPAGLLAWLLEVDDDRHVHPLARHLTRLRDDGRLPGAVEIVPGARTVLLDGVTSPVDARLVDDALHTWDPAHADDDTPPEPVEIRVRYDGADLDGVARLAGLTTAEVVRRHTGAELTVAFCGFSAGFAYLTGMPPELHLPRLDTPRTGVPAGSVGIAEEFTGVYPRRSPGGWRLLGRTDAALWDERRDPPALLAPGARVRFTAARG
jgi:KipI family sensor histidine kinase inhibitor